MYQRCEVHWKLRNGEVGDVCWLSRSRMRLTAGARLPRAQVLWSLSELGTVHLRTDAGFAWRTRCRVVSGLRYDA